MGFEDLVKQSTIVTKPDRQCLRTKRSTKLEVLLLEVNRRLADPAIPRLIWNNIVQYRIHKSLSVQSTSSYATSLGQM